MWGVSGPAFFYPCVYCCNRLKIEMDINLKTQAIEIRPKNAIGILSR
jgi:hypothetical protein